MSKSREIYSAQSIVEEILLEYPIARNSDDYLYVMVCSKIDPEIKNVPFSLVMIYRNKYHVPAYETVSRIRRKLQETNPELRAYDDVEAMREMNAQDFKDYARMT